MAKEKRFSVLSMALLLSLIAFRFPASGQTVTGQQTRRLVISFNSICCGIDHDAQNRLDDFIKHYEKAKRKQLTKATVHWGKEGEVDYCLPLSELSQKERKTFISNVRSLIGKSRLVDIKENAPCQIGR